MKYNTLPLKNITDNTFVGKYDGQEFILEPSETRYLPTFVSRHLAKQLYTETAKREKNLIDESEFIQKALGTEILTAETERVMTFAEEIQKHEKDYRDIVRKKELENVTDEKEDIREELKNLAGTIDSV